MKRSISVIVPTTVSLERAPLLWRALRSLQEHQHHVIVPIVVVNGTRYLPEVLESLRLRQEVASRFVWKFGAALPVPLADALSRRTTIVDLCHSG